MIYSLNQEIFKLGILQILHEKSDETGIQAQRDLSVHFLDPFYRSFPGIHHLFS